MIAEQTTNSAIDLFKQKCNNARNEDEIKMACRDFMSAISIAYSIPIDASSEVTSFHGGRSDSIYNDVYFEFKDLNLFKGGKGKGLNDALYGRDDSDHGLFHYLINYALDWKFRCKVTPCVPSQTDPLVRLKMTPWS